MLKRFSRYSMVDSIWWGVGNHKMNLTQEIVLQNGKYRIDAVLGLGEFGVTYQATHHLTDQTVAIKTLHPKFITSVDFPQIKQQFLTVAKRLSQCHHPNLARVLDIFEEQGLPYLVMNYISNQTLEETLKTSSPLSVHQALQYIRQISSALRTLHQQGLLHGNLQPKNILLHKGTDILTLVDFGLTSGFIEQNAGFPIRNRVLSVGYASLEHYLPHQHLTPATDIYSLAATFYCLLTGEPPLESPLRVNEATQQLLNASKPSLRQIQPTLSPVVERLIFWGLEIEPSRRPQSVDQWIAFLPIEDTRTVIQSANTIIQAQNPVIVPATPEPVAVKAIIKTPVATLSSVPASPPPQIRPVLVDIPTWEPIETTPSLGFLLPILFLITSLFFGWVGFDLTRRYGSIISQKTNIQLNHPFNNLDSTEPMFENPSVETQAPAKVAAERSTEEPLEVGDDSTSEPSDVEAETETTAPVDQYSNASVVAEPEEKSSSTSESQLEQYLLSPSEENSYSEVGSEPPVTDSSVSDPVTSYSDENAATVPPYTPPEPSYSEAPNGTLPTETTSAGGGGSLPEEPVPNSYTEPTVPTVPVEPEYPVSSEETTPMTSTPNYETESTLPTSPLTPPISN